MLCRHFAEAPAPCTRMCDCCRRADDGGGGERRDVTEAARGALRTLQGWTGGEKRATLNQLGEEWRRGEGKRSKRGAGLGRE